jgi:hypothetical protein
MKTLGYGMFSHTALRFADLPAAPVPAEIFNGCTELKTVYIKAGTKSIGKNAFYGAGLGWIYYEGTAEQWGVVSRSADDGLTVNGSANIAAMSFDGGLFLQKDSPDGNNHNIGATALFSGTDVTIPSELGGKAVTGIAQNGFRDRPAITGLTVPDTVKQIYNYAFTNCTSLKTVSLPGIVMISEYAFSFCGSLSSIRVRSPQANAVVLISKLIDEDWRYFTLQQEFPGVGITYEP